MYFTEEVIQITCEQIFTFVSREMKTQTTMRYLYTSTGMTKIKYTDNIECWHLDSHTLLVGV